MFVDAAAQARSGLHSRRATRVTRRKIQGVVRGLWRHLCLWDVWYVTRALLLEVFGTYPFLVLQPWDKDCLC